MIKNIVLVRYPQDISRITATYKNNLIPYPGMVTEIPPEWFMEAVVTPTPTFLTERGSIDWISTYALIGHLTGDYGNDDITAVFVNGFTGEFPWLTEEQKKENFRITVEAAGEKVPVLVGAAGETLQETIRLCELAQGNAFGIVIAPFYFSATGEEAFSNLKEIAKASDLPIMLYNNPAVARLRPAKGEEEITPALFERIIGEIENVAGIKESSPLFRYEEFKKYADKRGEVIVMSGNEAMIDPLGEPLLKHPRPSVPSISNIDPKLVRRLYDARENERKAVQAEIIELGDIIYGRKIGGKPGIENTIGGIKHCLYMMGIGNGKPVDSRFRIDGDHAYRIALHTADRYS